MHVNFSCTAFTNPAIKLSATIVIDFLRDYRDDCFRYGRGLKVHINRKKKCK